MPLLSKALSLLGSVSIRVRIAALVALALAGAAVFGAIYLHANSRIDQAVAAQEGYRRLNDLAAEAQTRFLAMQVAAEQFLRDRDGAHAEAYRADLARIAELLAAMPAVPQAAQARPQIDGLAAGFTELDKAFAAVEAQARRLGLTEQDGLRGALNASVRSIESELKMWPNAAPLMVDMLQMRQAEKDFMIYGSESLLGNHRRFAAQFDFGLDATTLPASTRQNFRQLLEAYSTDMQAFGEGTAALAGEVTRLGTRQAELRPQVEALFLLAHDGMIQAVREQESVRSTANWETSLTGIFGIAAFTLAGLAIAVSIVRPLRAIEGAMQALADGDHQIDIPGAERGDEIGDMAKAVVVFKRNAEDMARLQAEQESVRKNAEIASRNHVLSLASRFEEAVKAVADDVSTKAVIIHQTAGGIAGAGEGDGDRNAWSLAIAEAAEQARDTVAAVTRATEELTQSVGQIAEDGAAVRQVVGTAVSELHGAEERVHALAEMARRIDRVVALIGEIAHRTNMLSLNATIEAQRAGPAGKGFAVVANEVKHLASQTAQSTREIAAEVAAIQTATTETVSAISSVGRAVRQMDQLANSVHQSVERQTVVTRAIEQCVVEVTEKTKVLSDGVTAFTHSAARQCGAAAKVLWAAEDLAEPTETLQSEVKTFLTTVRTA